MPWGSGGTDEEGRIKRFPSHVTHLKLRSVRAAHRSSFVTLGHTPHTIVSSVRSPCQPSRAQSQCDSQQKMNHSGVKIHRYNLRRKEISVWRARQPGIEPCGCTRQSFAAPNSILLRKKYPSRARGYQEALADPPIAATVVNSDRTSRLELQLGKPPNAIYIGTNAAVAQRFCALA